MTPEGWKYKYDPTTEGTVEDNKATTPARSVGTPQLEEGEIVVEDGFVRNIQYFIVMTHEGKFYSIVPEIKKGRDFKSPKKNLRQDALEDAFRVLNNVLPEEFLARASRRFPDDPTHR